MEVLNRHRDIQPNIDQGRFPFRNIHPQLTRADIEWLLATHEENKGPVNLNDKNHEGRTGLDMRGANLSNMNLSGLPLARLQGGLGPLDIAGTDQHEWAGVKMQRSILTGANLDESELSNAHLEGALLSQVSLRGAIMTEVHMEVADLSRAHLQEALLYGAHLEGANLERAHLERANLKHAHLEGATLVSAHLEEANLKSAFLSGANLINAFLEKASLEKADLKATFIPPTRLEHIRKWDRSHGRVFPEQLQPADLRRASFDSRTRLDGASMGDEVRGGCAVADVVWGGVNLAVIDWTPIWKLGDEREAGEKDNFWQGERLSAKEPDQRLGQYQAAVRACRQVAVVLRGQGLDEDASYYAFRAQILQREVLRREQKWGGVVWSLFLGGLAGYGYRPLRTLGWYLGVLLLFWMSYYVFGQTSGHHSHLTLWGSLVFSVTSFHGRGFFPGGMSLDDPVTRLAALEAVIGLFIEISFIATFTQRYFGR